MSTELPFGLSLTPPASPWGINFGGGLNSTALILECYYRHFDPDWILFADTGSEMPGTLEHVERMQRWVADREWTPITVVRWERVKGPIKGFEPLHANCLRTNHLPSKAYGYAGCTSKWKIQPMDRWRKAHGFQKGAFAVGYDADEKRRITTACKRGDQPNFTAWYPLVAWGMGREACQKVVDAEKIKVGKSSCFMCPNMKVPEWLALKKDHPKLFKLAQRIEENAADRGNYGRGGGGLRKGGLATLSDLEDEANEDNTLEDRCHHGGCFT